MAHIGIIKSNLIFGGAQIVQMLTIVLRAKLIAVMLGSAGMGLNAILQSVLHIVNNVCACGIMQSSVREISQAYSEENLGRLHRKIHIFRRLLYWSAGIGFGVCALGAWPLSIVSLGHTADVGAFVVLGLGTMFFTLMQGEVSILQGTRQVKALAISSIIGSTVSLAVCVPCYYFFSMKGVALSIVLANFVYWLIYLFFTRKLKVGRQAITLRQALKEGKPMIRLGFVLMLGSVLVTLFTYLTNISIRLLGSISDVGLYQGAAAIATQSILVITSVLAADFFPRLSAVVTNKREQNQLINEQLNIVVLAVVSIASVVVCFAPVIINLLLSPDFLEIASMLRLMAVALLFRGLWIVMSYVILANGDRKAYFFYDGLLGNGINFMLCIMAYNFWGLTGIGVAHIVSSVLVAVLLFAVSYHKYDARLTKANRQTLYVAIVMAATTYTLSVFCGMMIAVFALLVILCWSLNRINRQYHVSAHIQNRLKRK